MCTYYDLAQAFNRKANFKVSTRTRDHRKKGHLEQQKQRPAAEAAANVTPLSTKSGENTSEVLL